MCKCMLPISLSSPPKSPSEAVPPQPPVCARGLTDAALAVLPQLVVVAALAAVLRRRHLHAVLLAAAVVQGTRVQGCEAKGQNARHKNGSARVRCLLKEHRCERNGTARSPSLVLGVALGCIQVFS